VARTNFADTRTAPNFGTGDPSNGKTETRGRKKKTQEGGASGINFITTTQSPDFDGDNGSNLDTTTAETSLANGSPGRQESLQHQMSGRRDHIRGDGNRKDSPPRKDNHGRNMSWGQPGDNEEARDLHAFPHVEQATKAESS